MVASTLNTSRVRARVSRVSLAIWRHQIVAILFVALFLSILYAVTWFVGGVTHMAASWFCLPVIAAGGYLGYAGGLGAAVGASLLAGPLMPLDVASQASQAPSLWIARSALFIIVGLLSAAASSQVRASYRRQLEVAEGSRDLAIRKAAMAEMVSKEFRAPLAVLSAAAHALSREGVVTEEGRPLLEGLAASTQRLVDLVTAVSTVLESEDRGGGLAWETFSVKPLLKSIVDHLGIRDPWSRVSIEIAPPARACETDAELLRQLLQHLIEFAVRSSDEMVTVRVERPSEDRFTFEVVDRGPGMDDRARQIASDPFSTGILQDGSRKGFGLGLFAARRLAEVLGGTLAFSDHPGGGTVATVSIPATSPEPLGP